MVAKRGKDLKIDRAPREMLRQFGGGVTTALAPGGGVDGADRGGPATAAARSPQAGDGAACGERALT